MPRQRIVRTIAIALLFGLAACVAPQPAAAPPVAAASVAPSAAPQLRPELGRKWFDDRGGIRYPSGDGFAAAPVLVLLPAGLLLDRFGPPTGRFFSPKGAPYSGRALPYVCDDRQYNVYRLRGPLPAWAGRAAPWFDQRGGGTQFQTDASAQSLIADGVLEPLPADQPAPCG